MISPAPALFELLVSRRIEQGKRLICDNEKALRAICAYDADAPYLFYVLSGWAEYSLIAANIVESLASEYERQEYPDQLLSKSCFIAAGMANLAHYQNRDADVEGHCEWIQKIARLFRPSDDLLGTIHLVWARSTKRQARYIESMEFTRTAIGWYEKANLPGMVAVAKVTEAWLLMQTGDFQGATRSWAAADEYLEGSEDWTLLGNIRFAKARRLCHANCELEAVVAMQDAIDFYSKSDPSHRNLSRCLLELANLRLRMASRESNPGYAEELRNSAAANIARAGRILTSNPPDHRNWGRKLLCEVNQVLYNPQPSLHKMRQSAQQAYNFAELHKDELVMARAKLKQAVVERRAAIFASRAGAEPVSLRLRALEYADAAAKIAHELQNDRLKARVHTFRGNLLLEFPFNDRERATMECDIAVRAMAQHEDKDYLYEAIRRLEAKLNSPAKGHSAPSRTIFIVTASVAFSQSLDDTIRTVEHAAVQAAAASLGRNANPHKIAELLGVGHHKVAQILDQGERTFAASEPTDGDNVVFRVTEGMAITQPLEQTVQAVEYAIVRDACILFGRSIGTICKILRTGRDRIGEYFPKVEAELARAGYVRSGDSSANRGSAPKL